MLRLYNASPGGSAEIQLLVLEPAEPWERLKRNAVRFLRDSDEPDTAAILESLPFELWSGTNSFNDEFHVLNLRAGPKAYIDFEKEVNEKRGLWKYRAIAETLGKLGCHVRFIAVAVEFDSDVEAVALPDLRITSDVVERALSDAETLIRASGAVSGLDRVHTDTRLLFIQGQFQTLQHPTRE
jgi:hypothetical protein